MSRHETDTTLTPPGEASDSSIYRKLPELCATIPARSAGFPSEVLPVIIIPYHVIGREYHAKESSCLKSFSHRHRVQKYTSIHYPMRKAIPTKTIAQGKYKLESKTSCTSVGRFTDRPAPVARRNRPPRVNPARLTGKTPPSRQDLGVEAEQARYVRRCSEGTVASRVARLSPEYQIAAGCATQYATRLQPTSVAATSR